MNIKIFLIFLILLTTVSAKANSALPVLKQGILYSEAKASLIEDGWIPIKNSRIERSSLYAQEIYERGTLEVVDCISMELDACWFRYKKRTKYWKLRRLLDS